MPAAPPHISQRGSGRRGTRQVNKIQIGNAHEQGTLPTHDGTIEYRINDYTAAQVELTQAVYSQDPPDITTTQVSDHDDTSPEYTK